MIFQEQCCSSILSCIEPLAITKFLEAATQQILPQFDHVIVSILEYAECDFEQIRAHAAGFYRAVGYSLYVLYTLDNIKSILYIERVSNGPIEAAA